VISLVKGTALEDAGSLLSPRAMGEVAVWLGETIDRLHAIPLQPAERDAARDRFRAMVVERHATVGTEMAGRAWLSPALLDGIDAWLPPIDELLRSVDAAVLTHGNLHVGHILGHHIRQQDRFEPTGIISFSRAGVGHPLWDLGPIWWSFLRGRPGLTADFLATARIPDQEDADFPRLALAWSLLNPGPVSALPPGVDEASSLDELAARSF
jgi:hygromycin-B 7''-O-kinase